jgi:N utilization substance protein B
LQVLFQDDLNPRISPAVGDAFITKRIRSTNLIEMARDLVAGVRRNREQLDQAIEKAAENWSIGRMAPTDRNVLRMGAYELLYAGTPAPVAINEALDLAKRFGTAQSSQFVNGILDRLMRERAGEKPPETTPPG